LERGNGNLQPENYATIQPIQLCSGQAKDVHIQLKTQLQPYETSSPTLITHEKFIDSAETYYELDSSGNLKGSCTTWIKQSITDEYSL